MVGCNWSALAKLKLLAEILQLQGDSILSGPKDLGPGDLGTWGPGNMGTLDQGTRIGIHCMCMYIVHMSLIA